MGVSFADFDWKRTSETLFLADDPVHPYTNVFKIGFLTLDDWFPIYRTGGFLYPEYSVDANILILLKQMIAF